MIIRDLLTLLYDTIIDLNIFPLRDFGSNVNRTTAKRLGRYATRLYIILFIIYLVCLTLYIIIQPRTITKTFNKPSLTVYTRLMKDYGDKLECSCSLIASAYDQFVEIEPIFHPICSSDFASDEWRINITSGLVSDLSPYSKEDYRRFLSAHLQFLIGLCQISEQLVNDSVNQFLTSLFISTQLLSEETFNASLDSLIQQSKSNAPTIFARLLFLIRSINQGNGVVSSYGTNFKYIIPWKKYYGSYAPTEALIYDDKCSCDLSPSCTSQANFIINSSTEIPIKGLKIGCLPSESFRASTLECFYDQSCIHLIQQYTNYTNDINSTKPLSTMMNQSSINTTIGDLIDNLFIEYWSTSMDYPLYYKQCSPLLCSYTHSQQFNLLYTTTLLLGLQGGLAMILQWICPLIIRTIVKIYHYRKKQINIVHPITPVEITNNDGSNSSAKSIPTNVTLPVHNHSSSRYFFKILIICILMMLLITSLIIFSIYMIRQKKN